MSRLSLVAPIAIVLLTGCRDDAAPGPAEPTPMEEAFPVGCAAPSNGNEVTCVNLCEKIARCTVGLCAQQTGAEEFCEAETFAALHASCMAGCTDESLAADEAIHQCALESTCTEAFVDKKCTPDVELTCVAPEDSDSGSTTEVPTSSSEDDSTTTGYGYDSTTTSGDSSTTWDGTSSSSDGGTTSSESSTG